jgi:uncharacterized protein YdaU (DUF1376 family)
MSEEHPAPLVESHVDCSDLDGFMLNSERLMSSELLALYGNEIIGAALLLWCRAWKQRPAASLPDDDRINAAFARLPLAKYRKVKEAVLRGFVKCSDGRLYHRFLSVEANKAYGRKVQFRQKRTGDAKRLKKWRDSRRETPNVANLTNDETQDETRFVADGNGKDRDRDWTGTTIEKTSLREVQKALREERGFHRIGGQPITTGARQSVCLAPHRGKSS